MGDAASSQYQRPASAGFTGAKRAENYFEEWPTERTAAAGVVERSSVAAGSRGTLRAVPQKGDITNSQPGLTNSEALLAQVADTAAPSASPVREAAEEKAPGLLSRLFGGGPSRARIAAQTLEGERSAIRLASWPRSGGILVANPKGGVGKTPVSIALGGVFASIRGGQTAVFEVTDDPGALSYRAEGPARAGLAELVRDIGEIRGAGQLAAYTAQQTSYASIVGTVGDREPLTAADVQNVSGLLGYFYPVRVMDSANQVTSTAFQGALSVADVLVIPVANAIDSLAGAQQLIRSLQRADGHPAQLAKHAIALRIDDGRPSTPEVRTLVTDTLERLGVRESFEIPFDPHLAARTHITFSRLRPGTVAAFTHAAAAITTQLTERLTERHP